VDKRYWFLENRGPFQGPLIRDEQGRVVAELRSSKSGPEDGALIVGLVNGTLGRPSNMSAVILQLIEQALIGIANSAKLARTYVMEDKKTFAVCQIGRTEAEAKRLLHVFRDMKRIAERKAAGLGLCPVCGTIYNGPLADCPACRAMNEEGCPVCNEIRGMEKECPSCGEEARKHFEKANCHCANEEPESNEWEERQHITERQE